jgi:nitroreductase
MQLKEAIKKRHSIRSYEPRPVPKKILIELVKAGTKAPSASNRQPWIFYCVCSKKKRDAVSRILKGTLKTLENDVKKMPGFLQDLTRNFYNDLGGCQNLIFVFRPVLKNEADHIKPNDITSISLAVENIMLSAVEKGLGTCWVGSFNGPETGKKVKKALNVPKNQELVASFLIGYPKRGYKPLVREKKKLNEILKFV